MVLVSPKLGTFKKITFVDGTAYSQVETSVNLPTSKPASPQLDYNITADNLPTVSNNCYSYQFCMCAYVWGQNSSGSNRPLSYEVYLNDVLTIQGSYTANTGNYFTLQAVFPLEISAPVGKNIKFYVWDTSGTCTYMGKAASVNPDMVIAESGKTLYNFNWANHIVDPIFSTVLPSTYSAADEYYKRYDEESVYFEYSSAAKSKKIICSDPYAFTSYYMSSVTSENSKVTGRGSTSKYPFFRRAKYPHELNYRVMLAEKKI